MTTTSTAAAAAGSTTAFGAPAAPPSWHDDALRLGAALDQAAAVLVVGRDGEAAAWAALGAARAQSARRRVAVADLVGDAAALAGLGDGDEPVGIADSFFYGVTLNRIARPVDPDGTLFVLPSGSEPVAVAEVLSSDRWRRLVGGFRDAGALLVLAAQADAPGLAVLAGHVDGLVIAGELGGYLPEAPAPLMVIPTPRRRASATPPEAAPSAEPPAVTAPAVTAPAAPVPPAAPPPDAAPPPAAFAEALARVQAAAGAGGAAHATDGPAAAPRATPARAAAAPAPDAPAGARRLTVLAALLAAAVVAALLWLRRPGAAARPADDAVPVRTGAPPRTDSAPGALARPGRAAPSAAPAPSSSSAPTGPAAGPGAGTPTAAPNAAPNATPNAAPNAAPASPPGAAAGPAPAPYALYVAGSATPDGAGLPDGVDPRAVPVGALTPQLADGATWWRLLVGAYPTRAAAEAALARLQAGGVVGAGSGAVVRAPYALLVADGVPAAEAPGRVAQLAGRGVPAYALPRAGGAVALYAGAFERPQQSAYLARALRAAGVQAPLVERAAVYGAPAHGAR